VFGRLDPQTLAHIMMPAIQKSTSKAVQTVARQEFPEIWEALPQEVREEIYDIACQVRISLSFPILSLCTTHPCLCVPLSSLPLSDFTGRGAVHHRPDGRAEERRAGVL
jgi:hypothetical protein